jgi:hypothetical protein
MSNFKKQNLVRFCFVKNLIFLGIQEIRVDLKLAGKMLRAFRRRLVSDKILLGLILLIVIGIIVIIIVKTVYPSVKLTDVFKSDN